MPKVSDSLCPLGFHPQVRWPNRCKRCFRDYGEHKAARELSGSTTSLSSLGSYDVTTNTFRKVDGSRESLVSSSRVKDEVEGITRSRSDLSPESLSRSRSEDDDEKDRKKWTHKLTSWTKTRPTSWSAQDLRQAVEEAKEQVRISREELSPKHHSSTRSLTQDLGELFESSQEQKDATPDSKTNDATPKYTSFSSYLAMRTRSPARPPVGRTSSLQGTASTTSSVRKDEDFGSKAEEDSLRISRSPTLPRLSETKAASVDSGRPPKPPARVRVREGLEEDKPKKIIQSLRPSDILASNKEVRSEEGADASYVIQLGKSKRDSSVPKRVEIDLQPELNRLQKETKELHQQVQDMAVKNQQLEDEKKELLAKRPKFGDVRKQAEISKLQQKVEELQDEMKEKNKDMKDLKKEIDRRPLPKDVEKTMEDLRSKLQAAEQLCEELMDESEDYKKEVRALEEEIEEMQDNFREDQADEYRDLKRELEQTAKNCRVLQFKLKKAERRSDQLERDKVEVEDKLKELQLGEDDLERAERIKTLEKELGVAKEISLKMHEEMEKMKNQLEAAEVDKKMLTERVGDKPLKAGTKVSRSQVLGRQGSQDNTDQLVRDLQDSMEREQDLKEQMKFAEEETKSLRKKLSRLEEENETLALQLKKMSSKAAKVTRQKSQERSGSLERAGSVERGGSLSRQGSLEKPSPKEPDEGITEDLDPTELKIQLELNEQEAAVLRRKVEGLESENERLQKEIKDILSRQTFRKDLGSDSSRGNPALEQKVKGLELDATALKQQLLDLEAERDQLRSDLDLAKKRSKITKNRAIEQGELDVKKHVDALEKEVESYRSKTEELGRSNEKLMEENKRLQLKSMKRLPLTPEENLYIDKHVLEDKLRRTEKKLKDSEEKLKAEKGISSLGNETDNCLSNNDSLVDELKKKVEELQAECKKYSIENLVEERTPKNPKDTTPKATLIKWVAELEGECAKLQVSLREAERRKAKPEDAKDLRELESQLAREKERNEELSQQLWEESRKAKEVKAESQRPKEARISEYEERLKKKEQELEEEKEKCRQVKEQLQGGSSVGFEELRSAQAEKHRAQKELWLSQQDMTTMERRLKEAEEALRLGEKTEKHLRAALDKAESKVEEERSSMTATEERHKEMTMSWLKERDELKKEVGASRAEKEKLEADLSHLKKKLDLLDKELTSEKDRRGEAEGTQKEKTDEIRSLKSEKENLLIEVDDMKDTLAKMEKDKEKWTAKRKKEMEQAKKDKEDLQIRMKTLESELKSEKKKRDRIEAESLARGASSAGEEYRERLQKVTLEVKSAGDEVEKLRRENKALVEEYDDKLSESESSLKDLQAKYELLEDDFAIQKAQLVVSNEGMEESYFALKRDHDTIQTELRNLRETYNLRQDTWIREKLGLQERLKDFEERLNRATADAATFQERQHLRDILDDKNNQIDKLHKSEEVLREQVSCHRREAEELRRKVEDLEKLQEISERRHAAATIDKSGFEGVVKDLRNRIATMEKSYKAEATKVKMRSDSKQKALMEEVSTLTQHMAKYRRERDTYKDMFESTQKNLAELRGANPTRISRADNANEAAAHLDEVHDLQGRLTDVEDRLADSRLEVTKLKNELADEKTAHEIQLCEVQTKLNEYEESRLLEGGRRVPGLTTRLELNWQKEREEQQRLIQETATLAKDLRETLYEVERERDFERLEAKRKIEQLRKTVGQEHQDTKVKVQELQRDLLELRDAHAKLRQINEKLRREKDRTEVEREAMRDKFLGSSREHLNQQIKMERTMEELRRVRDLAPLVLGEAIDGRDASLTSLPGDPRPKTKEEFMDGLRKLTRGIEELNVMMGLSDDRDRLKRAHSFRKALSIESDDEGGPSVRSRSATRSGYSKKPLSKAQKGQLHRKAQSLDHQMAEERNKIWLSTDAGSTSSIESAMTDDLQRTTRHDRDVSVDRMSTGSQTSEPESTSEKRKSGGLKGVFSKFGRARSIEETCTGESIANAGLKALSPGIGGSGSDVSVGTESGSVKGKLKTLFKKNAPPSRTKSTDRDGPNVRQVASQFDTASLASCSSVESTASVNVPPVLRRFRTRDNSTTLLTPSQSSFITEV